MATKIQSVYANLHPRLLSAVDSCSLAYFRIVFGVVMLYSQCRFLYKGWVRQLYIEPKFYFKYFGFYWVKTLPGNWMYLPWILMCISLIFIILGKYYRVAIVAFFLLFSYTELLDVTNYLNHYALVSYLSFLMLFLPMNASYSLDALRNGTRATVPAWMLYILQLQVGLVYFMAGVAKIETDWLLHAMPLKIWLAICQNIPFVGPILALPITAYVFSWVGMLFDLTAPFLLLNKKTRRFEYALVVVFHLITMALFYIGIFPALMIVCATIFFSKEMHQKFLEKLWPWKETVKIKEVRYKGNFKMRFLLLAIYFFFQFAFPLRYLFYSGNSLWTEQGFRFSWRVMLMEKMGYIDFTIKDAVTGKTYPEFAKKHLTPLQEKMMSTQPDMILQYAHFLGDMYQKKLQHPVAVYVDSYVSLNGRRGQTYIDPNFDLMQTEDSFAPKNWILTYNKD